MPAVPRVRAIPLDRDFVAQKGAAEVWCTKGLLSTSMPMDQYSAEITAKSRTALLLLFHSKERPCAP